MENWRLFICTYYLFDIYDVYTNMHRHGQGRISKASVFSKRDAVYTCICICRCLSTDTYFVCTCIYKQIYVYICILTAIWHHNTGVDVALRMYPSFLADAHTSLSLANNGTLDMSAVWYSRHVCCVYICCEKWSFIGCHRTSHHRRRLPAGCGQIWFMDWFIQSPRAVRQIRI